MLVDRPGNHPPQSNQKEKMNRPTLEVADIIRAAGNSFIERNRNHLAWPQLKVLRAIRDCRTATLGGHLDQCSRCGRQAISYNSCLMESISFWGVRPSSS